MPPYYHMQTRTVHHHHYGTGVGIGSMLAAYLSWTTWHSVGWAMVHFFCSWIYVIYWAIEYW